MEFHLTVDKTVQAVVDQRRCINCGACRTLCPTGAMEEYQKTVWCGLGSFGDAKKFAVENACSMGCPLGIVPQAVAALVKAGELERAYELIAEKNPLPRTGAQVCDGLCRDMCKRELLIDEGLDMPGLESYILSRAEPKPYRSIRRFHEQVAVIGGGPAGIAAAFALSKQGYGVTIFEQEKGLGGAMYWGIPDFRLDKALLAEEIDRIVDGGGIDVRCGCKVGRDITLEELHEEGFDAYLLAAGASYGTRPDLPGMEGPQAHDAVSMMKALGRGEEPDGNRLVVIGGGPFAVDMARVLVRREKEVICAAMEAEEDLQFSRQLQQTAEEEGVVFKVLVAPKQIIRENGTVKAIEFMRVEYIQDDQGIERPQPIKGSEFNLFCDGVIFAVGQKSSIEDISKVETYPDGKVKIDARHRTNKKMIFACGDLTGESGSVIEAMAAGQQAAAEIDNALQQRRLPERSHRIRSAEDGETLYRENINRIRPQRRQRILAEAEPTEGEYADDILPVIRSAGIERDMPKLPGADPQGKNDRNDGPQGEEALEETGREPDHREPGGGRMVAIAGGGISGITAAIALAKKGYRPTIFEKNAALGGSYRWLATEKRLDQALLRRELEKVEEAGIEVVYHATVGIRPSLEELKRLGYEAVLFAIGETDGQKPDLPNADCRGVFDVVTLMRRLADEEMLPGLGEDVVVTGSDEMTLDMARKLRDYGCRVTVAAPCSRGGLQVATSAVNGALAEGVRIVTGVVLSRINEQDRRVTGVDCRILENKLSMNIACDTLVLGGTKRPDSEILRRKNPELELDERGYMVIDDRLSTSIPGVFAIGDFNMSSSDAGRAGAAAIENFLTGGGLAIPVEFNGPKEMAVTHEVLEEDPEKAKGFEIGREIFTCRQAELEASRCMECGYHREDPELCIGCGVCASGCSAGAIHMVSAQSQEPGRWPNVKDIEGATGMEGVFAEEEEE